MHINPYSSKIVKVGPNTNTKHTYVYTVGFWRVSSFNIEKKKKKCGRKRCCLSNCPCRETDRTNRPRAIFFFCVCVCGTEGQKWRRWRSVGTGCLSQSNGWGNPLLEQRRQLGCLCSTKSGVALHIAPSWKTKLVPLPITSTTHPWQTVHPADHQNPV